MAISALPAPEYMFSFLILSLSSAIERIFFVSQRGEGIMLDGLVSCLNVQQPICQVPEVLDLPSSLRRYSWYVFGPINRGAATSTPQNSCSFRRKIIIKTRICCLRLGSVRIHVSQKISIIVVALLGRAATPAKMRGPKHTSCTSVGKMIILRLPTAGPLFSLRQREGAREEGSILSSAAKLRIYAGKYCAKTIRERVVFANFGNSKRFHHRAVSQSTDLI
jgi:hypothetical protein